MKINFVFLLIALGAEHSSTVLAQSPGTFAATGNMTSGRFFHTATLLTDGRVLIAGGSMRASAELFDPRTGKFTATRNMTIPREAHTATLLPDGKVLIAGGMTLSAEGRSYLAFAEIYDPFTGTFVPTGDMTEARAWHTATLLNNGRVLIAGGLYSCQIFPCFPAGAELYDPDTGTFTATGNRISEWTDTATLLPNGKVLITRGAANGGPFLPAAALYDPSTGVFTAAAGYANPNQFGNHSFRTAVLLTNGKVLIAAGSIGDGDGGSWDAELYDPATGAFVRTGNLITKREQHAAALLGDGTVLFTGGHIFSAVGSELYDPVTGTFSATGDMTRSRELHTATLLRNGQVLIAGGSDAELYTPAMLIPAPVLLSFSGDGTGQGAILHGNTPQLASSDNPAAAGEALEIYLTGLGDRSVIPPQVSISGRMAEVLWFGNTPGYAGLNQINVRVPAGVRPGPAVPVRLTYIGRSSNEVTIGVR